jgi:hypothetical protein
VTETYTENSFNSINVDLFPSTTLSERIVGIGPYHGVEYNNYNRGSYSPVSCYAVFYSCLVDTVYVRTGEDGYWGDVDLSVALSAAQLAQVNETGHLQFDAGALNDAAFDGVRVTSVPEPATWALTLFGVGLAGASLRRRLHIRSRSAAS